MTDTRIEPESWGLNLITSVNLRNPNYDKLVVLGSAPCLFDDFRNLNAINSDHWDIMAVNDAGSIFGGHIDYLVSQHWEKMKIFFENRLRAGGDMGFITISPKLFDKYTEISVPIEVSNGSSALYAAILGLKLGYTTVVLCGVPLTGALGEYYGVMENLHNNRHKSYSVFHDTWARIAPAFRGRVYSMSGKTKEILGVYNG